MHIFIELGSCFISRAHASDIQTTCFKRIDIAECFDLDDWYNKWEKDIYRLNKYLRKISLQKILRTSQWLTASKGMGIWKKNHLNILIIKEFYSNSLIWTLQDLLSLSSLYITMFLTNEVLYFVNISLKL